jgi:hypothetical protein
LPDSQRDRALDDMGREGAATHGDP